jgi:quercetin dioxygenase-like cupin family protein
MSENGYKVVDIKDISPIPWGNGCKVFSLLNEKEFQVMQETIPPQNEDCMHYHEFATQFLYVLSGELILKLTDNQITLSKGQGVMLLPRQPHSVYNNSTATVTLLTISVPGQINDRKEL